LDPLVPLRGAGGLASRVAELLLVALALPERMMRQLQVRGQATIQVEGGAEAGAEGDDQLDPLALDRGQPLHVGVVANPGGPAKALGHRLAEIEAYPALVAQVGRGQDLAVADHTREADRD